MSNKSKFRTPLIIKKPYKEALQDLNILNKTIKNSAWN